MHRIEFVVADDALGVGVAECVEPVIDGESLVEMLARVEATPIAYAGLRPGELLAALRRLDDRSSQSISGVRVLGCICGDNECAWASVEVEPGVDDVVWRNLRASNRPAEVYAGLGPFRFDRAEYEDALARPIRSRAPVRSAQDETP